MSFTKTFIFLLVATCYSTSFAQGIMGDTVYRENWKSAGLKGKVKSVQNITYYTYEKDSALTEKNATSSSITLQKFNSSGYVYYNIWGSHPKDTTDAVRSKFIYGTKNLLLRKEERNHSLSIYHKYEYTYEQGKLATFSEFNMQGMIKYILWSYNTLGLVTEKKDFHTEKDYTLSVYSYNSNEKLISMKKSKTDDEYRKWNYSYAYKKDLLIREAYSLMGDSMISTYEYDAGQRMIKHVYIDYVSYKKKYEQNFRITKSYNEQGLITEHKHYGENDSLNGYVYYKYDSKNQLSEEEAHGIPFGYEMITKYEYDEQDNWIRKYKYDLNGILKGKEEREITYY